MNNEEHVVPSIRHAGILYLISMILFVGSGEVISILKPGQMSYYMQMIFIASIQFLFVFLPTMIYLIIRKPNIKKTLRLNRVSIKNVLISILVMIFAIPVAAVINAIVILILNYFGKMHEPAVFQTENINQLIINLFVIALIPAVFEELVYRGVILSAYERTGRFKAIVISSLLFALMHRDLQSLVGTFMLGLVLAYIVYRNNSIFAGMIAHFTNNSLIVFMTYISAKYQGDVSKYDINIFEQLAGIETSVLIAAALMFIIFFVIWVAMFIGMLFLLRYTTRNIERCDIFSSTQDVRNKFNIPIIISLILVLFVFISQMI